MTMTFVTMASIIFVCRIRTFEEFMIDNILLLQLCTIELDLLFSNTSEGARAETTATALEWLKNLAFLGISSR